MPWEGEFLVEHLNCICLFLCELLYVTLINFEFILSY